MDKFKISFYESQIKKPTVKNTKIYKERFLKDVLFEIKSGFYKEQIASLRNLKDEIYKSKKEYLAAFTPSGLFSERKESGLISHSGLLCLDFDDLTDPIDIRDRLSLDKWVYATFISPSGKGVKALVSIDPARHLESFTMLSNHYEREIGLKPDPHCRNVSHLCFIADDPDLYENGDSVEYKISTSSREAKPKQILLKEIETITKRIEASGRDITGGYKDWLKLGFALADGIAESGRDYFHRLSSFHTEYNQVNADRQYNECLKERKPGITYQSFFYLCKSNGIDIVVRDELSLPAGFAETSKNNTELPQIFRVETFLKSRYDFRYNIILNKVEQKSKENSERWIEANEHSIGRTLDHKNFKFSVAKVSSLLGSDFVEKYNPFNQYFESLRPWDKHKEPSYIDLLCEQIIVNENDRERFNRHFKKMLVRCIACALVDNKHNDKFNKHVFVLISPKQSLGKSSFCRWLCPVELQDYYTENISFMDKDGQIALTQNFLINLDELASLSKSDINQLKTFISKSSINLRPPYGRVQQAFPRRANFIGSTNDSEFLSDTTGNVRFLCFEILEFKKGYWLQGSENYIDIDNVWSEAYSLYKTGFKYILTHEEQGENEEVNQNYRISTVEEDLIRQYVYKDEKKSIENFFPASALCDLFIKNDLTKNRLDNVKVGKILKSLGFEKEAKKRNGQTSWGYYLKVNLPKNNFGEMEIGSMAYLQ